MRAHVNHFACITTVLVFFLFLVPEFLRANTGTDYQRLAAITVESPTAVAVDASENIYIAESSKNRVQIFDYAGVFLGEITGLAKPVSVTVDANGRIFVGNDDRNNVEVYGPDHSLLFKLGQGDNEFLKPNGIAIDANGNIYVADSDANHVKVYDGPGVYLFTFDGTRNLDGSVNSDGKFALPYSLAIDDTAQEIIVLDRPKTTYGGLPILQGARIQVFDLNGGRKRSFDDLYGSDNPEKLTRPVGVAIDRDGRILVSDSKWNIVHVYDSNGSFIKTLYDLDHPMSTTLGLTVSHQTDKVYIAALNSHRVDIYGLAHTHVVNAVAGVGGTIFPLGEQTVGHGEFIDFAITPDPGYYLSQVLVDDILQDNPQKQFRLAIVDDLTVKAVFAGEISGTEPTPLDIVKPAAYVAGAPTTYPLLVGSGQTHTFRAEGGSGTYNWFVYDAAGNLICSQNGIGDAFTINIDDLFAQGAGVYKIVLIDVNDPGAAAVMFVRVPMRISPLFGNHKDTDAAVDFTVTGAAGTFFWTLTDEDGELISDPQFGTLPMETATPTNSLTLMPGIDGVIPFLVQARIDDPVLAAADLDTVISDPHTIMPVTPFTIQVVEAADGVTAVADAVVTAANDQLCTNITDATGAATLTGLVNTGAAYTFSVKKNGYLPATYTTTDLKTDGLVFLEAIIDEIVISGTVIPAGPNTYVRCMRADNTYISDSGGGIVQDLADEITGSFNLTLDNALAGPGPLTVIAHRPGFITNIAEGIGVLGAAALEAGTPIILQKKTKISITNDGGDPHLIFTISADPPFNGTPGEIQVFDGTSAIAENEVPGLLLIYNNSTNSYSYLVAAPVVGESVSIMVRADTSTSRTAASGYFAVASTTHVPGLTPTVETSIANPNQGSTTAASSSTGKASVVLPGGGLDGEIRSGVTVAIGVADALAAGIPYANWSEVVDVTLSDSTSGEKIDNACLCKIYITLRFDPGVVAEGGFEAGTWAIYHADNMTDLQRGNASILPVAQIVKPIDYDGGRVTFWVDHLSVFGIGTVAAIVENTGSAGSVDSAVGGGGGGCFIDASSIGASKAGFFWAAMFLGCLLALLALLLPSRKKDRDCL